MNKWDNFEAKIGSILDTFIHIFHLILSLASLAKSRETSATLLAILKARDFHLFNFRGWHWIEIQNFYVYWSNVTDYENPWLISRKNRVTEIQGIRGVFPHQFDLEFWRNYLPNWIFQKCYFEIDLSGFIWRNEM